MSDSKIGTRTPDQILTLIKELVGSVQGQTLRDAEIKERDLRYLRASVTNLRDRCESLTKDRNDAMRMLAETRDEFAAFRRKVDEAKEPTVEFRGKALFAAFRRQGEMEPVDAANFGKTTATEVQMMHNEIDKLHKANEELRNEVAYLRGHADVVLRPALAKRNDKVVELTEEIERLKRVNDNWQGAHAELSEKLKAERENNRLLKIENDRLNAEWQECDSRRANLQIGFDDRTAVNIRLREKVIRLRQQLEIAREVNDRWQSKCNEKTKGCENLREALDLRLKKIDILRAALNTAYGLIVRHHDVSIVKPDLGGFCPACHHKDGTEPEMEQIHAALNL